MSEPHLSDSIFGGDPDPDRASSVGPTGDDDARPAQHVRLPGTTTPEPPSRSGRRAEQEGAGGTGGPPHRVRRAWLPLLLALVLVVGGGFAAVKTLGLSMPSFGGGQSDGGGDYAGSGSGSVQIQVKRGDTGSAIGTTLEQAGVVKSARTFAAAFAGERSAGGIQPGTYTLRKQMSSAAALTLMLDPTARSGGVTVPEGLWAAEVYARLSKATGVPVADYTKVKASDLALPPGADGAVEGFLFPSTYDFPRGTTATEQLRAMVSEFKRQTAGLGLRADEVRRVVTIASLVQAESRLGSDGPKVARVIENRLKSNPATNGKLQLDSTVHFALQKRGTVTTTAEERQRNSPYNTYLHPGLPPGPVDSPGLEAIKAAQKPAAGSWLYFVTVNQQTGETRFATTYQEHLKNVAIFQTWCRANPGKC